VEILNKQNKSMSAEDTENKGVLPTTVIAASVIENEYFYPEANGYQAISVRAATLQDAEQIYLAKRKPVSPAEKVEETNNE
jgi:hypothetical protein